MEKDSPGKGLVVA